MRCSRPSARSLEPMLTTEQPMAFADVMTMLLFSVIWKAFRGFFPVGLFKTRGSIVSGTESLISPQRMRPSRTSSNSCMVFVGIGILPPTVGSASSTYSKFRDESSHPGEKATYGIDMICELGQFVLVDSMTDGCTGTVHRHLSSSCRKDRRSGLLP